MAWFIVRLALHVAPGYLRTFPYRLIGSRVTIRATVFVPLYHGGDQRLYGTFGELVSEARRLHRLSV